MNIKCLLEKISKGLATANAGGKKSPKLSALDRGVLKVSLLIAALDGEILPEEYAAFVSLVKSCRGATPRTERICLDEALAGAGYLMALAQIGICTPEERIKLFTEMASNSLPNGFVDGSLADLRRAFVLWVSMGASDGTFSDLERQAIKALADLYADLKFIRAKEEEEYWSLVNPSYRQAVGGLGRARTIIKRVALLEPDFFVKAEKIVRDLAVPAKQAKAESALAALVNLVPSTDVSDKCSTSDIALRLAAKSASEMIGRGVALAQNTIYPW